MKKIKKRIKYFLIIFFSLLFFLQSVGAHNFIVVDFYYSESCEKCRNKFPILHAIEENYTNTVIVNWKPLSNRTYNNEYTARGFKMYPAILIQNETKIFSNNITYTTLSTVIDNYIANLGSGYFQDENIIYVPFFGQINTSSLSLPILTIVLGGLDSFNPCAFFILIFLLNLLLYLQSRRRMLLVGTIFIFFSGFFYFIFMFVMFNTLLLTASFVNILSIVVGIVALAVGLFNIKDFFALQKGPSLSIPEEKRSITFKRIRKLVKSPSLLAMLGGTIFLAVSVNFYELLCTLGFPLIYTTRLTELNLPLFDYYLYIFFYNVVYVIPLIIILLLFAFTLGKTKLTEWQIQRLKLFSGIMIFSFGVLFIIDYMILENVLTALCLPLLSALLTVLISFLWKRYKKTPVELTSEPQEPSEKQP